VIKHLKKAGIIQGFWSLNPQPLDNNGPNLKNTPEGGFIRIDSYSELNNNLKNLLSDSTVFFTGVKSTKELGRIIKIADKEMSFEKKAEKFLFLIRK